MRLLAAFTYKSDPQGETRLHLTTTAGTSLTDRSALVWTGDTVLGSTAPQTPRKPSAARGRCTTYPRLSASKDGPGCLRSRAAGLRLSGLRSLRSRRHRPPWIGVGAATPLRRDHWKTVRASVASLRTTRRTGPGCDFHGIVRFGHESGRRPFSPPGQQPRRQRHRNSTAQLPQASALPSLGRRRTRTASAPASLARVARAPAAPHRTPDSRRTLLTKQPPQATPGHHSRAGLNGAAAERDALRRKRRESDALASLRRRLRHRNLASERPTGAREPGEERSGQRDRAAVGAFWVC